MNLGDGLLFELQNGKPRLILLHRGVEKNLSKQQPSFRPRAANILSSRQQSCVEEAQRREEDEEEKEERSTRQPTGRRRDAGTKVGGAAASNASVAAGGSCSTIGTSSKTHDHHRGGGAKAMAKKVKSDRHKRGPVAGPPSTNGKTGPPQNTGSRASGKAGLTDVLANGDAALRDGVVRLTGEQLQQILNTVQTSSNGQNTAEEERTPGNKTASKCVNERGEMEEEDRGGGGGGVGGNDSTGSSQEKDNKSSGCLFSWLEERQSDSRAAVDAKKAQWKRELDEQVALKQQQQRSAPSRLQAEEDAESVLSVHREPPAAMRSSLRLGEVTPMEEVLSVERREEQKRRWLEELDRQREETVERRRREKLVQRQTEDHELWAAHFDSLQRRPLLQPVAPPPAQFSGSERGDWEPSSSLSLVWEAASSCGAESVAGASVDTSRTSYLRTMTSLLDPAQIEERERRRLKQLEQQRAIEAQVEERRRRREQDEAKRRQEEEEEDQRVALERETLQRLYEQDTLKETQKEQEVHQAEQPNKDHDDGRLQETLESNVTRQNEGLEDVSPFKHIAVQTEAAPSLPLVADRVQTPDVSAQYQPPPPAPPAPPPNIRSRASRTGKENMCVAAGGDSYEAFVRTEKSRRDKRRPEWNTQRPSRRFVPASQRYPASLQRNRQESRLKRQAELLALQERTCLSRTDPPPPPPAPAPPPPQHQEPRLGSDPTQTGTSPTRRGETGSGGNGSSAGAEGGRSPLVPVVRHRVQTSSTPPVPEFVPYVRTDDVFNLEPSDAPSVPPQSSTSPPAAAHRDPLLHPELLRNTHTHRQQEILRGLAQLRQGLLQKQRELETDLNPLLKLHDNGHRSPSTTHRM